MCTFADACTSYIMATGSLEYYLLGARWSKKEKTSVIRFFLDSKMSQRVSTSGCRQFRSLHCNVDDHDQLLSVLQQGLFTAGCSNGEQKRRSWRFEGTIVGGSVASKVKSRERSWS